MTADEIRALGWNQLDVVLVTGDALVDHPSFGAAVIARVLLDAGYKTAVIAQPDWHAPDSITVFGKPRLFFAVTSGNVDSMLTRYTAFKKIRNDDPYSADGIPGKRPQRAVIVYCNLIRAAYTDVPIVVGGIEASMRRLAHFDFWDNAVRRSILLDSRATVLVYGMGEGPVVEIARRLDAGQWNEAPQKIPGTVEVSRTLPEGFTLLLPEEEALSNKNAFLDLYRVLYRNLNVPLAQPSGKRFILHNPPWEMESKHLEKIYQLPFSREVHPFYGSSRIPAFEMIQNSLVSHRGCVSGCAFCSLALHQGRKIVSRSKDSIFEELAMIQSKRYFRGHITDIGGPSADMYDYRCKAQWKCVRESCLFPDICPNLAHDDERWMALLGEAASKNGIKLVTVGSGVRFDLLVQSDSLLFEEFIRHHVSGQLKIAPEHTEPTVLCAMRKTHLVPLEEFCARFFAAAKKAKLKRYIVPYLMSCHPGCGMHEMRIMKDTVMRLFGFVPQQVQAFIPLPMTLSSVMYWTGKDPSTGEELFVERDAKKRIAQHRVFLS
jgi:uncharacterized radical SAM protein YgiQ